MRLKSANFKNIIKINPRLRFLTRYNYFCVLKSVNKIKLYVLNLSNIINPFSKHKTNKQT